MPSFNDVLLLHRQKLFDLEHRLVQSITQLDDDDVNWRPNNESNSIANIVVHMTGNLRQRFVAGIGGMTDCRNRDEEFNTRQRFTKAQLIEMVTEIFDIVHRVVGGLTSDKLDDRYTIQGFDVSSLDTIFNTVTHMSEHVGQVLYVAKMRLGSSYQVLWMPHNRKEHP